MTTPTYQQQQFGGAKPFDLGSFQPFADQAYGQATSRMDPQWKQAGETFEQQMVNKGLSAGTEAYDKAFANFSTAKNDAYAGARNDALAQALAAQGQAFNQDLASYGANQGERQFGANMDFNMGQADFGNLMQLLGYGNDVTAMNNQTLNSDFQRTLSMMSLIPGMSPMPIDTQGAYGNWMNAYQDGRNRDAAARNARNQSYVQLASAFMGG